MPRPTKAAADRIQFRPFTESDQVVMAQWLASGHRWSRHLMSGSSLSVSQFLDAVSARVAGGDRYWTAYDTAREKPIGLVGLTTEDRVPEAIELLVVVADGDARKLGQGIECAVRLVRVASELGFRNLVVTAAANSSMNRFADLMGFRGLELPVRMLLTGEPADGASAYLASDCELRSNRMIRPFTTS